MHFFAEDCICVHNLVGYIYVYIYILYTSVYVYISVYILIEFLAHNKHTRNGS